MYQERTIVKLEDLRHIFAEASPGIHQAREAHRVSDEQLEKRHEALDKLSKPFVLALRRRLWRTHKIDASVQVLHSRSYAETVPWIELVWKGRAGKIAMDVPSYCTTQEGLDVWVGVFVRAVGEMEKLSTYVEIKSIRIVI